MVESLEVSTLKLLSFNSSIRRPRVLRMTKFCRRLEGWEELELTAESRSPRIVKLLKRIKVDKEDAPSISS